jgi:hypothetical protein
MSDHDDIPTTGELEYSDQRRRPASSASWLYDQLARRAKPPKSRRLDVLKAWHEARLRFLGIRN